MNRKLHTTIKSPVVQYSIGLLINCLYLLILINNNVSYQNLQSPEDIYSNNLWKGTDVLTYVGPARNFVNHGIFGNGNVPDYHRTIGYPLFLSTFMLLADGNWLIFTLFAQAAIFAMMYPLLTRISDIIFSTDNRTTSYSNTTIYSFLIFILAGTYIVTVPMIMTDTFFTVFFTLGIWLGLESIIKRDYRYLILHIIFIGYAAQVRPILSLYPIINCFILLSVSEKYSSVKNSKIYQFIAISFGSLLLVCNLPSIRNYINYGFLVPSDVLSDNMLNYLGMNILINVGRSDRYNEIQNIVEKVVNPNEKILLREKLAIEIYKDYPLSTLKQVVRNAIGIMGRAHWPLAANFWGYSFKDDFSPEHMSKLKSPIVFLVEIFFNLVYLIIFLFFLVFLLRISRSANVKIFLSIVLLIAYLLIPTLIVNAAGSRFRLPVEGFIVIMAVYELEHHFHRMKDKLLNFPYSARSFSRALLGRTVKIFMPLGGK